MRKEITEEVDLMRAEIERLNKDLLAQNACCDGAAAQDAHVRQEREEYKAEIEKLRAEIERLREAMTDMLGGWRYIRETYGDLAGVGWDRVEQKARKALEGKP